METRKFLLFSAFIIKFIYVGVFSSFFSILVEGLDSSYAVTGFGGTAVSAFVNWVGPLSALLVQTLQYKISIPLSGISVALFKLI
jgi:hypothetical protein